jgi:hypothetical protein
MQATAITTRLAEEIQLKVLYEQRVVALIVNGVRKKNVVLIN